MPGWEASACHKPPCHHNHSLIEEHNRDNQAGKFNKHFSSELRIAEWFHPGLEGTFKLISDEFCTCSEPRVWNLHLAKFGSSVSPQLPVSGTQVQNPSARCQGISARIQSSHPTILRMKNAARQRQAKLDPHHNFWEA